MQFPITGSCVLFGLFLAIKYVDKGWVNFVLSFYFCTLGTFGIVGLLEPLTAPLESFARWTEYGHTFHVPWLGAVPVYFTLLRLACFLVAAPTVAIYWRTKFWLLNNLLGTAFALQGIGAMSLGSFTVSATLLVGLFFYDVFWVFGTDKLLVGESVMVTVAKNLEAPILLKFPYAANVTEEMMSLGANSTAWLNFTNPSAFNGHQQDFSILGLGDIVIPGFFIALLLRFDAALHASASSNLFATRPFAALPAIATSAAVDPSPSAAAVAATSTSSNATPHASFPKPFFYNCLVAYAGGLVATVAAMLHFRAAQPALLYLVPACLGSALLTADARGALAALFAYDEEEGTEALVDGDGPLGATKSKGD